MSAAVSLLLADTARSQAYAQALAGRGIEVGRAAIVRSPERPRFGQTAQRPDSPATVGGVPAPDLSIPLADTVAGLTSQVEELATGTLNDAACIAWRAADTSGLTVFSGFGGEIVAAEVLAAGPPLLHAHSGWLPDYRGSTTMYYSVLNGDGCAVSALLLDDDIDTGPLVARRRYPLPGAGVDLDYVYDAAIRADLMADVVEDWLRRGGAFESLREQPPGGTTYFIIHPVLRKVALDRLSVAG